MGEIRRFPERPRPASAPLPDLDPLLRVEVEREEPARLDSADAARITLWLALAIGMFAVVASLGGC